jgi:hypothetical protein
VVHHQPAHLPIRWAGLPLDLPLCYARTMRPIRFSDAKRAPPAGGERVHHGYRLFAVRRGSGWRVLVHAPGSAFACAVLPGEGAATTAEAAFAEAARAVDRLVAAAGG